MGLKENLYVFLDEDYTSREDLFRKITKKEEIQTKIKDTFLGGILKREEVYPTGIKGPYNDFAIPHTDPENVDIPFITFIRPKNIIEFNQMGIGDELVNASFIMLLGVKNDGDQITLLQKIMGLFMDEDLVNKCKEIDNEEELKELLQNTIFEGE